MKDKKFTPAFIPCGDSMEKISEIDESALKNISGGVLAGAAVPAINTEAPASAYAARGGVDMVSASTLFKPDV